MCCRQKDTQAGKNEKDSVGPSARGKQSRIVNSEQSPEWTQEEPGGGGAPLPPGLREEKDPGAWKRDLSQSWRSRDI